MKPTNLFLPNSLRLVYAGLAMAALPVTPARAVLYNFNDTGQLAADFSKGATNGGGSGAGSLTNVSTGGLSNSGSLQLPTGSGNDTFLYTTKSSLFATFTTINVSVYFQPKAATIGGGLTLSIGLVDVSPAVNTYPDSPVSIPTPPAANSMTLTLRNSGSDVSSGLNYKLVNYNNGSSVTAEGSGTLDLVDGNWYQLSALFTYNGANSYTVTGQIYNSDASGTLGSALFGTAPTWTKTNAGLADGNAYGLLSSQNGDRRGLGRLDNYNLVPEPSSVLLLSGGLGLLVFARRSRTQRVAV